jgi:hypothetical protein
MPVRVYATAKARCWKEHTCIACGCVYRYYYERTGKASGGPGSTPGTTATHKAMQAVITGIEECPCPTCGTVQPDMAAKGKISWHLAFTLITACILLILIVATFQGALPLDVAGQVAAFVAGFGLLGHLITAVSNPNARLARNLRRVESQMTAGKVQGLQRGREPNYAAVPANLTVLHGVCLLALAVAVPAFLAVVYVSQEYPLPRNPTLRPDVVGPGDTFTVSPKTPIQAIGGNWRGRVQVQVVNSAETGAPSTLVASTDSTGWGKIIHVKSEKNPFEAIHPWVKVQVPNDPALGGKTLQLQMDLAVTYPVQLRRGGNHRVAQGSVRQQVEVQLAEAGAARFYKDVWHIGLGIGLGGCLLGGLLLTGLGYQLKGRALPHQVQLL